MTPRERVLYALMHREPDIVPLDLGSTLNTGIHVSSLYKLKVALGLCEPGQPVEVLDSFFMLGRVDETLRKVLGIDTIPLLPRKDFLGFTRNKLKPWTFFDGTPLLVPEEFNTCPESGYIFQYPAGDRGAKPSARMPVGGFYHDAIIRQERLSDPSIEDQTEEYKVYTDEDLEYFEEESRRLWEETDYAIVFEGVPGTNLGDLGEIPAPALRNPRGIRDPEEWLISLLTRRDFIFEVFTRMTMVALENLRLLHEAVGERIQVLVVSEADFGSQNCPLVSPEVYRSLFKPFHKEVNEWIHRNTSWKTMIHTCGSVYDLVTDFIEAGFDILNPIQISAANMDPMKLKNEFGEKIVFWGGGIDTQRVLPFSEPAIIRDEVKKQVEIFKKGGGFVFAAVHNIQPNVPVDNLIALFEAFKEIR